MDNGGNAPQRGNATQEGVQGALNFQGQWNISALLEAVEPIASISLQRNASGVSLVTMRPALNFLMHYRFDFLGIAATAIYNIPRPSASESRRRPCISVKNTLPIYASLHRATLYHTSRYLACNTS